jgi:hypothetical protein
MPATIPLMVIRIASQSLEFEGSCSISEESQLEAIVERVLWEARWLSINCRMVFLFSESFTTLACC